ncbi:MAG: NADH-quinone oxidoreductase subunit J [Candidatus Nitrosopolaris sp.]
MVDALFIGVAILTIGSAIVALETRELVYGAIGLAICMMGIAGFFLLLDSPFVAMFQITVYVGAVAVLVIFTVMLVRTQALFSRKEDRGRKAAGIVLLLIFIGGIGSILLASGLGNPAFTKFNIPTIDVVAIGRQMVTYYAPVLILLGLTLAASVIGALALARREDIEQKNERVN